MIETVSLEPVFVAESNAWGSKRLSQARDRPDRIRTSSARLAQSAGNASITSSYSTTVTSNTSSDLISPTTTRREPISPWKSSAHSDGPSRSPVRETSSPFPIRVVYITSIAAPPDRRANVPNSETQTDRGPQCALPPMRHPFRRAVRAFPANPCCQPSNRLNLLSLPALAEIYATRFLSHNCLNKVYNMDRGRS